MLAGSWSYRYRYRFGSGRGLAFFGEELPQARGRVRDPGGHARSRGCGETVSVSTVKYIVAHLL